MLLLLDTANLKDIRQGVETFAVSGVTTNPSIMQKEGNVDFFAQLKAIRAIIGPERSLHVQVTGQTADLMYREGLELARRLGEGTFVKVPATMEGLKAIRLLKKDGIGVTATAIMDLFQGYLAQMAGSDWLAVYYKRMKNAGIDADEVVRSLSKAQANVLGASFADSSQAASCLSLGAKAVTVSFSVLSSGLAIEPVDAAVRDFWQRWKTIHQERSILDL